ncbi:hypothetical protein GE09DRAFT_1256664 [Coniochaeta sp. 2T2.1]|nr:hypothetical protein GE09DRAFT_1256664 [Coniochaeta sp. 2T2.1]
MVLKQGHGAITDLNPPEHPKILQVGASHYLWVREIASSCPTANITVAGNFDPKQAMPQGATLYYNADSDALPFPENEFDYIHVRGQTGRIRDWPKFIRETFLRLAPGGYTEYCDISLDFLKPEMHSRLPPPWAECSRILHQIAADTGRPLHVGLHECAACMRAAGYTIAVLHDSFALDGETDFKKDLRRVVSSKAIAAATYHNYEMGVKSRDHDTYIKNLEHGLNTDCGNVVVQFFRIIGRKPSS